MNTNIKDLENKLWEIAEARKAKGGCQKNPRRSGYPRLETQAMMRCLKITKALACPPLEGRACPSKSANWRSRRASGEIV
jgi:hypothetical protein